MAILRATTTKTVERDILKTTINQDGILKDVQVPYRKGKKEKKKTGRRTRGNKQKINNKMVVFSVDIITLNVNGLSTPIKGTHSPQVDIR